MIITDARLNGMSGYEFLGQLKQKWPNLPVLMITAFATPKLAVEAIKAGAIDYLAKPFAPEELLHAVARCAERHRLILENQELRARARRSCSASSRTARSPASAATWNCVWMSGSSPRPIATLLTRFARTISARTSITG